jgi:hypothetical protein
LKIRRSREAWLVDPLKLTYSGLRKWESPRRTTHRRGCAPTIMPRRGMMGRMDPKPLAKPSNKPIIHLVRQGYTVDGNDMRYDGSSATLCLSKPARSGMEVVVPWDHPTVCKGCLNVREREVESGSREAAPRPVLFGR